MILRQNGSKRPILLSVTVLRIGGGEESPMPRTRESPLEMDLTFGVPLLWLFLVPIARNSEPKYPSNSFRVDPGIGNDDFNPFHRLLSVSNHASNYLLCASGCLLRRKRRLNYPRGPRKQIRTVGPEFMRPCKGGENQLYRLPCFSFGPCLFPHKGQPNQPAATRVGGARLFNFVPGDSGYRDDEQKANSIVAGMIMEPSSSPLPSRQMA
jgi:hypothetical protein